MFGALATWSDFAAFTRHIDPRGPTSGERGLAKRPVVCGGATIRPGDLLIGDDDGLVALAPDVARSCIGDARRS